MPTKKQKPFKSKLRQSLMFSFYTDHSNRETFSNAMQSSLKAGYSISQASKITGEEWFRKRLDNFQDVEGLAESLIRKNLEKSDINKIIIKEEIIETVDTKIMKIQSDLATWALDRLAGSRYKAKVKIEVEEHNNLEQNEAINRLFYKTKNI